jgi:DNA polymerase III sliding clamp (beta) subunit (PCNA family)
MMRDIVKLEALDVDFAKKATDSVTSILTGEDNKTIGARGDFLSICLSNVLSENVTMEFGDFNRAFIFKDDATPNKTILLMPMMIV